MTRPTVATTAEADLAFQAAQRVVTVHQRLVEFLRVGQTLAEIDAFVGRTLTDLACRSCFMGYKVPRCPPFPSHACLSLNECVVHGTAWYEPRPTRPGDVLKIDIGVSYRGWIGDAAWTYVFGHRTDLVDRLTRCGKESLRLGIDKLRPGVPYVEWARAVQNHVERDCGFKCIQRWGGHGYGRRLHEPPHLPNTVPLSHLEWPEANEPWTPGTLVAVEPMIAVGTGETVQAKNAWPVFTGDGSLSVHYEHDVLITQSGNQVLTEGLEQLDDLITR